MKYFILILTLVLFSCRTPETVRSVTKEQEQTDIANKIAFDEEITVKGWTEQDLMRLINERCKIRILNVKYDTDKPVDSLTNKHPVKEETNIVIEKDTETNESEKVVNHVTESRKTEVDENTEQSTTTSTEVTEKKKTGLNDFQKGLMYAGGLSVLLLIIFVIIKFK